MTDTYLFAICNLIVCAAVAFISFCRLNAMHCGVMQRVQSEYAGYMAASLASAMQPWWGEWPGWASIGMAGALLLGLACSSYAWRHGPPGCAQDNTRRSSP